MSNAACRAGERRLDVVPFHCSRSSGRSRGHPRYVVAALELCAGALAAPVLAVLRPRLVAVQLAGLALWLGGALVAIGAYRLAT
jgi:hypothetical protein